MAKLSIPNVTPSNRERRRQGLPAPPRADLSPVPPDLERIRSGAPRGRVTWIGHSTLLVQMAGLNILTDPHFSACAAPLPGLGPRRWQPPGLGLDELPGVDMVLISHNHYDHLDLPSVRALAARNPDALFAIPRGLERWFATRVPHAQVRSMDWDERLPADSGTGLEVCFVSVQHWSKRGLWDTDRSLWGGFALLSAGMRFFFAGDLGYSAACRDIGRLYGPFDLAAIPIGAFSRAPHAVIEGMIIAGRTIGARKGILALQSCAAYTKRVCQKAIHDAESNRLIGSDLLNSGLRFDVEIQAVDEATPAGDESAILAALNRKSPRPTKRPPYPTQSGINGKPTVVLDVRTVCALPVIFRDGAAACFARELVTIDFSFFPI